jgi:predicted TIM-barrel fold metal-dependent hydrolase
MDAAEIDLQVLSLTSPGTEQIEAADATELAREANDFLADAIKKRPARFAGFAALPTEIPDKAAAELQRMVCEHGFKGGSSMVTAGAAIWMTNSSGQSSSEPKP